MKQIITMAAIAIAVAIGGCTKKCPPKLISHNIPKQQWIGALQNIFKGIHLHLNNYTRVRHQYEQDDNFAFDDPNSSSILIPALGNVPVSFDIPVTRQDPYSIYINDVNSVSFTADAANGLATINITFESDGTEIVGDCVNNIICVCGSPQIDLSGISALIPLAFSPSNGGIGITAQDVVFTSTNVESGPCVDNACAFACDIFAPNRNSDMQKGIEQTFEDFFNSKSSIIATGVMQYLNGLGVTGSVVAIQIQANGDLMVEDSESQNCN